MKKALDKFTALTLALLIGLGTCMIAGDNQASAVTSDSGTPIFTMANNFGQGHEGKTKESESQGTSSSVNLPADTVFSSNWAGYVASSTSGDSYTSVSASWTVPDVSDSSEGSAAAQWVGLGGYSTSDLLQIGTIEYVDGGEAYYKVFYEKLPDVAQQIADVEAGSSITASVLKTTDSSDTWDLTYTVVAADGDTTTSTLSVTLDSSYEEEIGTSAEWISEDPANGNGQLYSMADMGTITYTTATVNGEALNASDHTVVPVALVSNCNVIMYPSSIGSDGMTFSTEICGEAYGTNTGSTNSNWNGFGEDDPASFQSQYPSNGRSVYPDRSRGDGMQNDRRVSGTGFPGFGH